RKKSFHSGLVPASGWARLRGGCRLRPLCRMYHRGGDSCRPQPKESMMDDIVKQAMARWPNVPDCFGWLGLDARGQWFLRDEATQARGAFPQSKGSLVEHEKLLAFIA